MFGKQFYPTPRELAKRMVSPHEKEIYRARVLEPSAGRGDLAKVVARIRNGIGYSYADNACDGVDVIEIDADLRNVLSGAGFRVVGEDFLAFSGIDHCYDVVIMNPPFSAGARHVLHAWEIMRNGGLIIALLNAETLRNPHTRERKRLAEIVKDYGTIEYVEDAFRDADRKARVDVAIVRLRRPAPEIDGLFNECFFDGASMDPGDIVDENQMVRADALEAAVSSYHATLSAYKDIVRAYRKFARSVGMLDADRVRNALFESLKRDGLTSMDADKFAMAYRAGYSGFADSVLDLAWSRVFSELKTGKFMTKQVRAEFDDLLKQHKALEFSKRNILSLVDTLYASRDKILEGAVVEVFDRMTKYHKDNRVHYEGWKTNDAFKVRHRVILPYVVSTNFSGGLHVRYGIENELNDIDRALCMLSGVNYESITRTVEAINAAGKRGEKQCETAFFHVRFFKKGTAHFTWKDRDLLDKFNLLAAKGKNWLPGDFTLKQFRQLTYNKEE